MTGEKLCACGHPIIVLQHERDQPEPKECFCCAHHVQYGPKREEPAEEPACKS